MAFVIDPISPHLLVSWRRKETAFRPTLVTLKKTRVTREQVPFDGPPAMLELLNIETRHVASGPLAKRRNTTNSDCETIFHLKEIRHPRSLLRRGLGYRIIFNMGGKVYNPEDPSTLLDLVFVVTDFFGAIEKGRLPISYVHWKDQASKHLDFFRELYGCDNLEVTYTFDKVVVVRDGIEELTVSQFDKLLSPEQLKIYNKYASVLGDYRTIPDHPSHTTKGKNVFSRFARYIDHAANWLHGDGQLPDNQIPRRHLIRKLKSNVEMFLKHLVVPMCSFGASQPHEGEEDFDDYWSWQFSKVKDPHKILAALDSNLEQSNDSYFTELPNLLRNEFDVLCFQFASTTLEEMHAHLRQMSASERAEVEGVFSSLGPNQFTPVLIDFFAASPLGQRSSNEQFNTSSPAQKGPKYTAVVVNDVFKLNLKDSSESSEIELPIPKNMFVSRVKPQTPLVSPVQSDASGSSNDEEEEENDDDQEKSASSEEKEKSDSAEEKQLPPKTDQGRMTQNPEVLTGAPLELPKDHTQSDWDLERPHAMNFFAEYNYHIIPLIGNNVIITDQDFYDRDRVQVDLEKLHVLKDWQQKGLSAEEVWTQCSFRIERPEYLPRHTRRFYIQKHTSKKAFVQICWEERIYHSHEEEPNEQPMILYYLDLTTEPEHRKWVSASIPSPDPALDTSPKAIFHSATTGLIFTAMGTVTLSCYSCDGTPKQIKRVAHTALQADLKQAATYWIEKKGRVFFYCVQSSPEIKLLVICYHKQQFVTIDTKRASASLGAEFTFSKVLMGQQVVGAVFHKKLVDEVMPVDGLKHFQILPHF